MLFSDHHYLLRTHCVSVALFIPPRVLSVAFSRQLTLYHY